MADDVVKVDAIVVGGGPAGLSASLTMARAGLEVILIERGEYAGSKNVGGLLYGTVLNKLIPDAFKKAPIERPVSRRCIAYLGDGQHMTLDFGADEWSKPPYNNTYIVNRSQFDRWFAREVEKEGVTILEGTVVDDLLYEGDGAARKVAGVRLRGDEQFRCDVVILAEGANCLVTKKAMETLGMLVGTHPQEYAVGVKEIIGLPREKIEDRFNLEPHEGAAMDFIGVPFKNTVGGGFIYTAKEAIHLGAVVRIETMVQAQRNPNEILDAFKRHPGIRKYVEGGELLEYSAHMLPEGGYGAIGQLSANGLMICGDAAGLLNMSIYKEGTNHAMESGLYAAETAAEAKKAGSFSRQTLASYESRLRKGVVLKDLKKYSEVPDVLSGTPGLFSLYPQKVTQMLVDYFAVTDEPKSVIQKKAIRKFLKGLPKLQFLRDVLRARKMV
jgi:electron transfer flavoprotein-quinone oxidoreductase